MSTSTDTKIKLRSRYASHKVELEAPVMQYLPNGGHVIVKPTKMIRFERGMAEVTAEDFELLKNHTAFVGSAYGPRDVWLEDDPDSPAEHRGVRVIDGAMSASTTRQASAPTPEWDSDTPANLRKAIANGKVNPQSAMEYEMTNGRRALVLRALADAIASTEQEDEPTEAAPAPKRTRAAKDAEPLEDVAVPLPDDGKVT